MKKSLTTLLLGLAATAAVWAIATSCSRAGSPERPVVTVSIPPQKYILEQIAGDGYDVVCLLGTGGNPETYDPSVANMLDAGNSAAYLLMGNMGFETAVADKLRQSNPSLPVYDTSAGIEPVRGTHGHDEVDPHTWTSVRNAGVIAANMCRAMSEIDPANAPLFKANLERFTARLDSLDAEATRRLAPRRGQAFMVWHPALSYLARDYGLRQIAVGGEENKELSIPALRARLDSAAAAGPAVFFVNGAVDGRNAVAVAGKTAAVRIDMNPLAYEWLDQMQLIINALATDGKEQ